MEEGKVYVSYIYIYIYIFKYRRFKNEYIFTSCLYVLLYVKRDSDRGRERNLIRLPEARKTQLLNTTLHTYIVLGPEQN